jgi:hypothetical protein
MSRAASELAEAGKPSQMRVTRNIRLTLLFSRTVQHYFFHELNFILAA